MHMCLYVQFIEMHCCCRASLGDMRTVRHTHSHPKQLQHGAAEIFGTDILPGERVHLQGHKLAIFTWTGCSVLVEGTPSVMYVHYVYCVVVFLVDTVL